MARQGVEPPAARLQEPAPAAPRERALAALAPPVEVQGLRAAARRERVAEQPEAERHPRTSPHSITLFSCSRRTVRSIIILHTRTATARRTAGPPRTM